MDYFYLSGIIGASFILVAFFLTNYKDLDKTTLLDEWLNLIGSLLLLAYSWNGEVWPFVVLNTVWATWSAKILIEQGLKK